MPKITHRGRTYEELSRQTTAQIEERDSMRAASYEAQGIEGEIEFRKPSDRPGDRPHLATFWHEGDVERYCLLS